MFQVVFYNTQNSNEIVLDFIRELPPEDKKNWVKTYWWSKLAIRWACRFAARSATA